MQIAEYHAANMSGCRGWGQGDSDTEKSYRYIIRFCPHIINPWCWALKFTDMFLLFQSLLSKFGCFLYLGYSIRLSSYCLCVHLFA